MDIIFKQLYNCQFILIVNIMLYYYTMHNNVHDVDKICEHFKDFVLQLLLNTFTVDIDKFE